MINSRPIATILLKEPLKYESFSIECVELPAPKSGSPYSEGWEHAECAVGMTLEDFMALHPSILFKTDSLQKEINPEVAKKYGIYTLKFHEHTLRYVVEVLEVGMEMTH